MGRARTRRADAPGTRPADPQPWPVGPGNLLNTPGGNRTRNLRIWNPLLCQLSYRREVS
jgi:hypothetical protein